jgi:phage terminase small subunit
MLRKSAQQKLIEGRGAKIGTHRLDSMIAREPKAANGLPPCPARLTGDAKKLYQYFAKELELMELDKAVDGPALERACVALALAWKCDRMIRRHGAVTRVPIVAGTGSQRKVVGHREAKSKWFGVKIEAEKQFHRFATPFGVTGPSSRAALSADYSGKREADAELQALLEGPRAVRPPNWNEPDKKPC